MLNLVSYLIAVYGLISYVKFRFNPSSGHEMLRKTEHLNLDDLRKLEGHLPRKLGPLVRLFEPQRWVPVLYKAGRSLWP